LAVYKIFYWLVKGLVSFGTDSFFDDGVLTQQLVKMVFFDGFACRCWYLLKITYGLKNTIYYENYDFGNFSMVFATKSVVVESKRIVSESNSLEFEEAL
jgi:hypothetical protein